MSIITEEDIANIKKAIDQGGKIWENKLVSPFKKKVKAYYLELEKEQCCYCKKNFTGEFKMVIDIEHILPKGKQEFKNLMFTLSNLNVACKRCNMTIKGTRVEFVTDVDKVASDHENSKYYKFIHPNVDNYFEHLKYHSVIENNHKVIKYQIVSNSLKGQYTYDFFRLNELEIDSFSLAQGTKEKVELSKRIKPEIQNQLRDIFTDL